MDRRTFLKLTATSLLWLQGCTSLPPSYPPGYLRVEGSKVVDGRGEEVLLRGFNVAFRDFGSVLGEEDIGRVAGMGGNLIRLWYTYKDFESSPFTYRRGNLDLLADIARWCERQGVYIVLCNHLAPGGQNTHDFVVQGEDYSFWKEEENRERYYSLWGKLAKELKGEKALAGYDLLNEGVPPDLRAYRSVLARAAGEVREHDPYHMLVVEETRMKNNRKRLVKIDDPNTLYSVHFFFPSEMAFYTTTRNRPVPAYPGEMLMEGKLISQSRSSLIKGSQGWREVEVEAAPPPGAEILVVRLVSEGNTGDVWVDDVHLSRDRKSIDLPAPLVSNPSFESDYSGFEWEKEGAEVVTSHAYSGRHSLRLSGDSEARSSPIKVQRGVYRLSAMVRAEGAEGENYIALSWHRKRVFARLSKGLLKERLQYALEFKEREKVPLFVGEFSSHRNPFPESVKNYLQDVLSIFESHGLHWSYWAYYSSLPGIGVYSGNEPYLSRPLAVEVLKKYV